MSGGGRALVAVYALFAVAATGRSVVQLASEPRRAPLAYGLSLAAALVYVLATVALARHPRGRRVAVLACGVELTGVVTVGVLSLVRPALFPDATVWSSFGVGYGLVPLILPILGLAWLRAASGPARMADGLTRPRVEAP